MGHSVDFHASQVAPNADRTNSSPVTQPEEEANPSTSTPPAPPPWSAKTLDVATRGDLGTFDASEVAGTMNH